MKSPQISTVIVALVFAGIAYFVSSATVLTPTVIAIIAFAAAFIAPLISSDANVARTDSADDSGEEAKTLYVGNLPYRANETAIRELFSQHGTVHSVRLMKDKHTGKRRGFGFVEMSASTSDEAIAALNDTEFQQRTLKVREAKERPERTNEEA